MNLRRETVPIAHVVVGERQRRVSEPHVQAIVASFERTGGKLQLQPIVIDQRLTLIDGAHRLLAARQAGWQFISAVIVEDLDSADMAMLEVEANLVRKSLGPANLEAAWRQHYEPWFRAQARQRQLAALNKGAQRARIARPEASLSSTVSMSVSKAAKLTTGLSMQTLSKVTEIRAISVAEGVPDSVRDVARAAMLRLESAHASVTAEHRAVMTCMREGAEPSPAVQRDRTLETMLTHALSTEQLAEQISDGTRSAAESLTNIEMLRSVRMSLTRALASVTALERRAAA